MILLEGKIAVVTGGASGIGETVVRTIAKLGGRVIVADIDEERATEVAADIRNSGGEATAFVADIMVESQIKEMQHNWTASQQIDALFAANILDKETTVQLHQLRKGPQRNRSWARRGIRKSRQGMRDGGVHNEPVTRA